MSYPKPFILQRADPHMSKGPDDYYYFTASVPQYDRIELRRAEHIDELPSAPATDIWHAPDSGPYSSLIWAPELHYLFDQWVIYFAAAPNRDIVDGLFQHRMYAVGNKSKNPFATDWEFLGQVDSGIDTFCLDATHFEHNGQSYYVWAQKDNEIPGNSNLYISTLSSPTQLANSPVRLSIPDKPWEQRGFKVNEGPAALIRNGKVMITYSASATDENYCMGLLWADQDADLLDASNWHKSDEPIFTTNYNQEIFGPGHNSFVTDEQGNDLLVYHARNYTEIEGDPLWDPNRHTRIQTVHYDNEGLVELGEAL
ncbi:family 43 glycosylhydrolase [Celerinatantimonas sp. MCCC 1A17872]|uniref:glycoside hydrolase family 43 protein n=1 Tax=Celerinatantimonas sp. MCCC 1A17872 TaxID=3177514 RepID=UPI0038BF7F96